MFQVSGFMIQEEFEKNTSDTERQEDELFSEHVFDDSLDFDANVEELPL